MQNPTSSRVPRDRDGKEGGCRGAGQGLRGLRGCRGCRGSGPQGLRTPPSALGSRAAPAGSRYRVRDLTQPLVGRWGPTSPTLPQSSHRDAPVRLLRRPRHLVFFFKLLFSVILVKFSLILSKTADVMGLVLLVPATSSRWESPPEPVPPGL